MQIKMFVIKPTDHNGFFSPFFLSAIPLALNAAEMYFCVRLGSENDLTFFAFVFCVTSFYLVHDVRQTAREAATTADWQGSSQGQRHYLFCFFSSRGYVIRG